MLFKCSKGMFLIKKNHRDAFNLEVFIDKYIEECFDNDSYIVGDISSNILRLKGFDNDPKSPDYFGNIEKYIQTSCVFGCPHYVLKRIRTEDEYNKLQKNPNLKVDTEAITITPIEKENFDKESLVLKTSQKNKPHIVIDSTKMNSIPKGSIPKDIQDFIDQQENSNSTAPQVKVEEVVETQTYVSASPDFDPSKKENFRKNKPKANNNPNKYNNNKKQKNKKHNDSKK